MGGGDPSVVLFNAFTSQPAGATHEVDPTAFAFVAVDASSAQAPDGDADARVVALAAEVTSLRDDNTSQRGALARAQSALANLRVRYHQLLEKLHLLKRRLTIAKAERLDDVAEAQLAFDKLLAEAQAIEKVLDAAGGGGDDDLLKHECLTFRSESTGSLYAWELERGRRSWRVPVRGGIVVNDGRVSTSLAEQGLGLAYAIEPLVAEPIR